MNILFDINHPVDMNFFKNSIKTLNNIGHEIFITYRPRGKLETIINTELEEFSPIKIGKHHTVFVMKILGQLKRDISFLFFLKKNKIDLSVGSSTNAISSWLLRIPHFAYEDDFEYKIPFYHANIFATRHIMPSSIDFKRKNVYHYNGLKELAYLHPSYFTARLDELNKYGLTPDNYVFIRKVAHVSLNYKKEDSLDSFVVKKIKKSGLKILLSLEDKKIEGFFKDDCLILKEPVDDIFSLLKYALFTISSGDSMARESCVLGTPTIYVGRRNMQVNKELIDIGCMFKEDNVEGILSRIDYLSKIELKEKIKKKIEYKIRNEWDNPTKVLLRHIKDFEK